MLRKLAVSELEGFSHPLGDGEVVGDDDEGDSVVAVESEEEVRDVFCGRWIERAGGLVGEDKFGLVDEGAGDGGAEFFAAGELPWEMVKAVGEADIFEELERTLFRVGGGFLPIAGEAWDEDVFENIELRKEVLLLKNETERVVAESGCLFFRERRNILIADGDRTRARPIQGAKEIEKR